MKQISKMRAEVSLNKTLLTRATTTKKQKSAQFTSALQAAAAYNKEANKIQSNLAQLVKDVNLIEENKFMEHLKDRANCIDPTEELFGDEVQESIQNESGMQTLSWGPKRRNINFINEKPALVQTESVNMTDKAAGNVDALSEYS